MFKRLDDLIKKMDQWRVNFLKNNKPFSKEQREVWNENCRVSNLFAGEIELLKEEFKRMSNESELKRRLNEVFTLLKCIFNDDINIDFVNGKIKTTKGEFDEEEILNTLRLINVKLTNDLKVNPNSKYYKCMKCNEIILTGETDTIQVCSCGEFMFELEKEEDRSYNDGFTGC